MLFTLRAATPKFFLAAKSRRGRKGMNGIVTSGCYSRHYAEPIKIAQSILLFHPVGDDIPVNILEKSVNVGGAIQSELGQVGMFEDVHDQERSIPHQVAEVMFVNPGVGETSILAVDV